MTFSFEAAWITIKYGAIYIATLTMIAAAIYANLTPDDSTNVAPRGHAGPNSPEGPSA